MFHRRDGCLTRGVAARSIRAGLAVALLAGAAVLAGLTAASEAPAFASHTTARAPGRALPEPVPFFQLPVPVGAGGIPAARSGPPPTSAQCLASIGVNCYWPYQIRAAYGMGQLYANHETGKGETIVIVDSFGSPTIGHDLAAFDSAFKIPGPPELRIIAPAGKIPAYYPNPARVGWAEETTLDVEWSHAMAPGARILLVETPINETIGTTGFPQMIKAENYVVSHKLGNVISQSFGAPEQTFPSANSIESLRSAYKAAARAGVSVLAAAGDEGASGPANAAGTKYFTRRVVSWPASDPLVTAVGGTELRLNSKGQRIAPDVVWNDTAAEGAPAATGGGVSSVFARPRYQDALKAVVGAHRGIPDISLSASISGAVLIYASFPGGPGGWQPIAGTSEATPLLAGIVAIADQVAGHGLGLLNPTLYRLGAGSKALVDITSGNNSVFFTESGTKHEVVGYRATKGFDLASGNGTPYAPALVAALAKG